MAHSLEHVYLNNAVP